MIDFEPLHVAVRVHALRSEDADGSDNKEQADSPRSRRSAKRRQPHRTLVIDTETTADAALQLLFGIWRYYVDSWDSTPGRTCVEEGILYADDLPVRDPEGFAVLQSYRTTYQADVAPGRRPELLLLSRSEFIEKKLWPYAYNKRARVVGFNLPFDLSRLAIGASPARRRFAGGISLRLWEVERFRPRIAYKAIDSKRTLIGFTAPDGADENAHRGHFLDLRTLSFALTDRGHTLMSACRAFGVDYTKREVTLGIITPELVTYCGEDVGATTKLYRATLAEYVRHPIDLQPTKAFSPASIGKAYLRAMGIRPILERQPDFDPTILGWGMAAFFGGRAECRIRKIALPVVYVDYLSMYPTVNALMRSWDLVTARTVTTHDVTAEVRRLAESADLLDQCFRKGTWQKLLCMVEIEPDGDVLPVRAAYDPAALDYGIGVNPYRNRDGAWYSLADVLASVLSSGKVPIIRRAIAFRGVGRQSGLRPVKLRNTIEIDPLEGDFFRRVIELRHQVRNDETLDPTERDRLERFLKVLANATSYGILAEYTRHELSDPIGVDVYGTTDQPFSCRTKTPEDPGPFCFPPLAAAITGGARLMLTLLERSVTDPGGNYMFCDTDSMGIVAEKRSRRHLCPGGSESVSGGREAVRSLSWDQVDEIVERFAALNPYNRTVVPGSILKIEKENFRSPGRRRQLWCYAISAKRYALFEQKQGGPELVLLTDGHEESGLDLELAKVSEHGLGHLLNPQDPDDDSEGWIFEAWTYLLRKGLELPAPKPEWLNRPALVRVTASSPAVLSWFKGMNERRAWGGQVKPANFLLLAHPDPMDPSGILPAAPYDSSASRWEGFDWIDRRDGSSVRLTTDPSDGTVCPGVVRVRTYGEILAAYEAHPEAKSLGPDGKPVGRRTTGLLLRRSVECSPPLRYIGKEGNRLDERISGLLTGPEEYRTEYMDPDRTIWSDLVVPVLKTMDRTTVANAAGVHRRTLERWLYGGVRPRLSTERTLTELTVEHAATVLRSWGMPIPRGPSAVLHAYVDALSLAGPVSDWS